MGLYGAGSQRSDFKMQPSPPSPRASKLSAAVIEHRKDRLRSVKLFETMSDAEISNAALVLEDCAFPAGALLMKQGEEGNECFVVDEGECFASVLIDGAQKEVKQYGPGGFFGERALLRSEPRAATITCRTVVQ